MTSLHTTIAYLMTAVLWVVLVGSIWRRRYREWVLFPIFVFIVAVSSVLALSWPARFRTPETWMVKEGLHHIFRVFMAIELGIRTFRAFPGAMATLKRVLFVMLLVTIALVVMTAPAAFRYETFVGEFQPRVLSAAIWLFTGIAVLILWYRLPVSRFQKAIVVSYVLYLPIYAAYLSLVSDRRWQGIVFLGYLYQLSYLGVVSFWAYVCWRKDPPRAVEPPSEDHGSLI